MAFYDEALPHVFGYLSARCPSAATAEELTSEVFLAAVDAVRKDTSVPVGVGWAIAVARHKLVDHWRRLAREERGMRTIADRAPATDDPWEVKLDQLRALDVLQQIAPQQRAALCLRYLDDLSVSEVAAELDRTVHATEALLVRARIAFRRHYEAREDSDG